MWKVTRRERDPSSRTSKTRIGYNLQELGTKMQISFHVSFKGLCYIYKKSVFSFYFEIDIEQNLCFVPDSHILYLILV